MILFNMFKIPVILNGIEREGNMKKIICHVNKATNYIYHILSVAKVGYDNDYGEKYRSYHDEQDLKYLNDHGRDISVEGGSHCGNLYGLLITEPARSRNINFLIKYYELIIDLFENKNLKMMVKDFAGLWGNSCELEGDYSDDRYMFSLDVFEGDSDKIIRISKIFLRNIDTFEKNIWPLELPKLEDFKSKLEKAIHKEGDLIGRWEASLNGDYMGHQFEVMLCSALENGPQAIDISPTKDVFNVCNKVEDLMSFISHEIGSFIILTSLTNEMKENLLKYWVAIEGLASYHNKKILFEKHGLFPKSLSLQDTIESRYRHNPQIRIVDMIQSLLS